MTKSERVVAKDNFREGEVETFCGAVLEQGEQERGEKGDEEREGTYASDSGMERMGSLVVVIVQPCREIERVPDEGSDSRWWGGGGGAGEEEAMVKGGQELRRGRELC